VIEAEELRQVGLRREADYLWHLEMTDGHLKRSRVKAMTRPWLPLKAPHSRSGANLSRPKRGRADLADRSRGWIFSMSCDSRKCYMNWNLVGRGYGVENSIVSCRAWSLTVPVATLLKRAWNVYCVISSQPPHFLLCGFLHDPPSSFSTQGCRTCSIQSLIGTSILMPTLYIEYFNHEPLYSWL
jgi:hypothetical protein